MNYHSQNLFPWNLTYQPTTKNEETQEFYKPVPELKEPIHEEQQQQQQQPQQQQIEQQQQPQQQQIEQDEPPKIHESMLEQKDPTLFVNEDAYVLQNEADAMSVVGKAEYEEPLLDPLETKDKDEAESEDTKENVDGAMRNRRKTKLRPGFKSMIATLKKKKMKLPHEMRVKLRKQIIKLYGQGWTVGDVAWELGITRDTVRRWVKRYETHGSSSLQSHYKSPCKSGSKRISTKKEHVDLIFDYICGLPVDRTELLKISIHYATLRRIIKNRYEQMCMAGAFFPNDQKSNVEDFIFNKSGVTDPIIQSIIKQTGECFYCTICNKPFKKDVIRRKHELIHTDQKPHECKYCDKKFRTASNLKVHERQHTGEKPYQCRFCDERFMDIGNCYKHIARRHKELHEEGKRHKVKSVIIHRDPNKPVRLRKAKQPKYEVTTCNDGVNPLSDGSPSKQKRIPEEVRHIIRQQIIELHEEGFSNRGIARRLCITHDTVSRWIKRYSSSGTFPTFYKNPPNGRKNSTKPEHVSMIFDYLCGLPVDQNELLKVRVCYATLRRIVKNKYDEKVKAGEYFSPEHKENVEDFIYNKSGVTDHLLQSIIVRKEHKCTICSKSLRTKTERMKHELTHTDVKLYSCHFCEKKFRTPNNLRVHERQHTGERPYQCRWCEKRFIDIGNCYKHIGRIHKSLHEQAKINKEKSVIIHKENNSSSTSDILTKLTESMVKPHIANVIKQQNAAKQQQLQQHVQLQPQPQIQHQILHPQQQQQLQQHHLHQPLILSKQEKDLSVVTGVTTAPSTKSENPSNSFDQLVHELTGSYSIPTVSNYYMPSHATTHMQQQLSHMQNPAHHMQSPPPSHIQSPPPLMQHAPPPPSHMQPSLHHMQPPPSHIQPPPSHIQPPPTSHPSHMPHQQHIISHSVFGYNV